MWRFILVSFAFMGWAFYELSGGADYEPRPDSLQVALRDTGIFATPKVFVPQTTRMADTKPGALPPPVVPQSREVAERPRAVPANATSEDEAVSRALDSLASLSTVSMNMESVNVTLAGASGSFGLDPNLGLSGGMLARDPDLADLRVDLGTASRPLADPSSSADIRRVSGDLVNMRAGPGKDYQQVDQLRGGTTVEVLETASNGWVRLRTLESGREGWMADWLITASN